MLDSPNASDTEIPREIPREIAREIPGQRLNFGSHFRLPSRKTTKRDEFGWGSNIRIRGYITWNPPDRKIGWARRVATQRLWLILVASSSSSTPALGNGAVASGGQCWGARMGGKGRGKVLVDTSKPKRTRSYVIREGWSVIHGDWRLRIRPLTI